MEREFSGRLPLPSGPLLIALEVGEKFHTGRLGTQWKIDGHQTGGRFSVVHHQLPPRTLAAPLHRHHREDEYATPYAARRADALFIGSSLRSR